MTILKVMFFFAPALLAWTMAVSTQSLPEQNRRLIERDAERLNSVERLHDTDIAALREVFAMQQNQISVRLSAIESYLFWLFVTTGGVGTVVGVDKASYYWVRANTRKRNAT